MLTAADQEIRSVCIGSSEAAAIIGVGTDAASEWDVYARLVHPELEVRKRTLPMRKGNALEDLVGELYAEMFPQYPLTVARTMRHPRYPFVCTSLDREVLGSHAVELKAPTIHTRDRWGRSWSSIFPTEYLVQVTIQLDAKGYQWGHLVSLIEGEGDIRIYKIRHDPELAEIILQKCDGWYRRHVLTRDPPALDDSDAAERYLQKRYPKGNGLVLPADPDTLLLHEQLKRERASIKEAKKRAKELTNVLRARVGDNDGIEGVCMLREQKGRVGWSKVAAELQPARELVEKYTGEAKRKFTLLGAADDDDEEAA